MNALSNRQENILEIIVEEYIANASPVSSQAVFDLNDLDVSCPTIRNEMADLTAGGYLAQPHTSAGRVPTEKGYRRFVDKLIGECVRKISIKKRANAGSAAKAISAQIDDAVIFVDENGDLKYIGLKKLFASPEFKTREAIVSLIDELERFEDAVDYTLERIRDMEGQTKIFIGSENPFLEREDYSMIVSPLGDGFISLLGPTRMNYKRNISMIEKFLWNI